MSAAVSPQPATPPRSPNATIPSLGAGGGGLLGSIQGKLVLPMAFVLIAVLAFTYFVAFRQVLLQRGQANMAAKAEAVADMAVRAMAEGVEFGDIELLEPMLQGIVTDAEVVLASVHDASGRVLVTNREAEALDLSRLELEEPPVISATEVSVVRPVATKEGTRVGAVKLVYTRDGSFAAIRRASATYIAWSGLALVLGLAAVWLSLGRVVRPVQGLTEATIRIVNSGDLTQTIQVTSQDEIGQLARAFNLMLARLRQIPLSLQGSVDDLGNAVTNLTSLTRTQTLSVQRQASGLAEASATTQEIRQTSSIAATKAETVLQVATRAEELSGIGRAAVGESIEGLQEIQAQIESIVSRIGALSERTLQVGEIIESVKDLADQSNVLALNAAIEAAKAGEFGKGFAVVAREIRSLADQSIQSTGRIREILSEIQGAIRSTVAITDEGKQKMEQSMAQIRASGESLSKMATIVNESSQAARQIAASVNQQNVGITQISAAIGSLNAAMDETSAGIRSAEMSADNLKAISGKISEIVQGFRV